MSSTHPQVFITNLNPEHDYQELEQFGTLVFMSKGYIHASNINRQVSVFASYFQNALPDDYICLSGPSVLSAIAVAIWHQRFEGVNLLYRDGPRDPHYKLLSILPNEESPSSS